jgi:ATP-dependent Clp protease ATP-binding subunit ClpC
MTELLPMTSKTEKAIKLAQKIAKRAGYRFIETQHVLYGLMAVDDSGIPDLVMSEQELIADDILESIEMHGNPFEEIKARQLPFSEGVHAALERASFIAEDNGYEAIGMDHLLYAILENKDSSAAAMVMVKKVDVRKLLKDIMRLGNFKAEIKQMRAVTPQSKRDLANQVDPNSKTPTLDSVADDLTAMARAGKLDRVVGREAEEERLIHILSRRTKNNPVLVGEPGVGKTAVVEGFAQAIADERVPENLLGLRLMSLNMATIIAGTKFRGEFEDRLITIIKEIEEDKHTLLFIDELHSIIGAGSGMDSSNDASNIMKPALARGNFRLIGATTYSEYQKYIEKDAALERRFAKISVEEPSLDEAVQILTGVKSRFESYHHVTYQAEAIKAAVELTKRYMPDRQLPDSAIDVMDEAGAKVKLAGQAPRSSKKAMNEKRQGLEDDLLQALSSGDGAKAAQLKKKVDKLEKDATIKSGTRNYGEVTVQDVAEVLANLTNIPVGQMTESESQRLLNLDANLHERVIGQDQAVQAVSRAIKRARSGIANPNKPMGSFMFMGPTGVGKTELAKALAATVFGSEDNLIRVDMSEYMEKFSTSRLIGAPPGYVGYDEGGQLTEQVRNKPYSVVLLDEIEKAHPDVFNLLLQILDDGYIRDTKGRKVDFRNTILILTSNLGATALRDDKTVGFGAKAISQDYEAMKKRIMEELKKTYRPEFINRIDEVLVFHHLTSEEIGQIVKLMLVDVTKRLATQNIQLDVTTSAIKELATVGFDPEYGARPLRRAIQNKIEDPIAEELLSGKLAKGQTLKVGHSKGQFTFDVK